MNYQPIGILSKYAKNYCHARIRQAGISDTEHRICAFMYFHTDACQDTVAHAMGLDKTTVAKVLSTLEAKGMILRAPNPLNRRKNILSITAAGKDAVSDVVSIYDDWFRQVVSCLSAQEQEQFSAYCSRLLEAAKQIDEGDIRNDIESANRTHE